MVRIKTSKNLSMLLNLLGMKYYSVLYYNEWVTSYIKFNRGWAESSGLPGPAPSVSGRERKECPIFHVTLRDRKRHLALAGMDWIESEKKRIRERERERERNGGGSEEIGGGEEEGRGSSSSRGRSVQNENEITCTFESQQIQIQIQCQCQCHCPFP